MYTICIAEDEYYVQRSIETRIAITRKDMEVLGCASGGLEAEELYYTYEPDLYFVDIHLPECSGWEFIEKIRKKVPDSQTLFIVISGYYDYENMRKAITTGIFDYLRKPIVADEFSVLLNKAADEVDKRKNVLEYTDNIPEVDSKELIERICQYIDRHYGENLSISDLAAKFYFSPGYFSHYFKKYTGNTVVRYLEEVRLKRAAEYLQKTSLPVAEIAQRVGYRDGNYMTKVFKKKYGISPGNYRKNK